MQFALKRTNDPSKLVGKLSFIDLAGSERGADTYDNARYVCVSLKTISKQLEVVAWKCVWHNVL